MTKKEKPLRKLIKYRKIIKFIIAPVKYSENITLFKDANILNQIMVIYFEKV